MESSLMTVLEDREELISRITQLLKKKVDATHYASIKKFITAFYAYQHIEILKRRGPERLAEGMYALWTFIQEKPAGAPKFTVSYWRPEKPEDSGRPDRIVITILNDNMPFLVGSLSHFLNRLGFTPRLIVHPILLCSRDGKGRLNRLEDKMSSCPETSEESLIYCEITDGVTYDCVEKLQAELPTMLADVRAATQDWINMKKKVSEAIETIRQSPYEKKEDYVEESIKFLEWVQNDHFTLLGYCKYDILDEEGHLLREPVSSDPLGILKDEAQRQLSFIFEGIHITNETRRLILKPAPLLINKTTRISNVHRAVPMDAIGVRCVDETGKVVAIHMFLGLFTSVAYDSSARDIPYLRRKVQKVLERAGLAPHWHDGKALTHILDSLPRDELFQAKVEDLKKIGMSIVRLQEHQRVALFLRPDIFKRSMSCLVYVPQDRFDSTLVEEMGKALSEELEGEIGVVRAQFGSLAFARVYYSIRVPRGLSPDYDLVKIENRLLEIAKSWSDELRQSLNEAYSEWESAHLFKAYRSAFPRGYQDTFYGSHVVDDIRCLEDLSNHKGMSCRIYTSERKNLCRLKLKIFQYGRSIDLSDILPILENLDLRVISEVPYQIQFEGDREPIWIHDFSLESRGTCSVDLAHSGEKFLTALKKVYQFETEDDGFNRLVMAANLSWRQCELIRAYSRYLKQLGFPLSETFIQNTLARNPAVTQQIADLFEARFNPEAGDDKPDRLEEIEKSLAQVESAAEDNLLRRYLNLILSTVRTNFFQKDAHGADKPCIVLKISCAKVEEMPLPRPLYEIFVYSNRVEGVHLRGGKVARGGIRWSDRHEDFRTEILGLMKAQMVKNTVIIPVGSKGGFVVKKPTFGLSREEIFQEGVACYQIMMQGLLDVTDNLVKGDVVPPLETVRHDEDDPYLVVAADKGTATFSDFANKISVQNGFWLGDAFASGGSQGYDHKKMGITARGAWESVKRHFRELGLDVMTTPFTVVGVGDMSGDVFGNGMLLSPYIKLVGAFNHRHIFIDPNPNWQESYEERKRLFELPRSSWTDYDASLLSEGGRIFDRQAKVLEITPEIKNLLNLSETQIKPDHLIRALLTYQADLLWFGGIGTYVKASNESHSDAGDRANDALRVNAKELNCRVIGEGANLGVTHLGRIEFVRKAKGRLNTDAVDNSAGVDCSDHEVNIKILLSKIQESGRLADDDRNEILREMTDTVAQHVLRDNYLQNLSLSLIEAESNENFPRNVRLIRHLETEGVLNRSLEYIPDDMTLSEMEAAKIPFTRPEYAVIMAYAKIYLYQKVLGSNLVEDPYFEGHLLSYFPKKLRFEYAQDILNHPLRREIIATKIINDMINRTGSALFYEIYEKTGRSYQDILTAYFVAIEVFDLPKIWTEIEEYDGRLESSKLIKLYKDSRRILKRMMLWLLNNYPLKGSITDMSSGLAQGVQSFLQDLTNSLDAEGEDKFAQALVTYQDFGIDANFAERLAVLQIAASSPDIILVATKTGFTISQVGMLYFLVGSRFQFGKIRDQVRALEPSNQWEQQQINGLLEDLYEDHRSLVHQILIFAQKGEIELDDNGIDLVAAWEIENKRLLQRLERLFAEMKLSHIRDLSSLSVVTRELRHLSQHISE